MNSAFKPSQIEKILKPGTFIARISPHEVIAVLWIQHLREHLAVMDVDWDNGEPADETMCGINADAVLVSVVADAILVDPASVKIPLPQPFWLICSSLWRLATLDSFILRPRVSLSGDRNKRGIKDLSNTGLKTLGPQVLLKPFKKLINDTRLKEPAAHGRTQWWWHREWHSSHPVRQRPQMSA
jgi:hypothetical protein